MHEPIRHTEGADGSLADEKADRIPEPESFPSNEDTASAAGSFEENTRNQLNILRERTFNPELRKLVDRVRVNEPVRGPSESVEGIDTMSDEELQLALYRLYYKARNINDNLDTNISFDPFTLDEEPSDGDMKASIARHFAGMMRHISFSPFALLSYNIDAKGYVPSVHDLEGHDADNIVISLKDGLFQNILTSRDGILVDAASLRDDPCLGKIFSSHDDGGGSLYFIMVNYVIDEIARELSETGAGSSPSFIPSSILMVVFRDDAAKIEPAGITRLARERLPMPLFLLNDSQSLVFSLEKFDDLSHTFDVLKYFFTLFLLKKDRVGISLHLEKSSGTSTPFMMKYIISKLHKKLYSDSVIINALKDSLIILTEKNNVPFIKLIFDEYISLYKDSFVINEFSAGDYADAHEIIQEIIINI